MNNMNGKIKHSGIIESACGTHLRVTILQTSACASCQVAAHCRASESKVKTVDIYLDNKEAGRWHEGQHVVVTATTAMIRQAMLWSFGAPFVLLLAVLFAMRLAGQSELVSAIGALGSLIPYYIGLFCFKAKLRQKIVFGIQTAETASPPQASSVGKKQNENEITI